MIKKMKPGESIVLAAKLKFKDPDSGFLVAEKDRIQVEDPLGKKLMFIVEKLSPYPGAMTIAVESSAAGDYPPDEPPRSKKHLKLLGTNEQQKIYAEFDGLITAASPNEFRSSKGLHIQRGDVVLIKDKHGKLDRLQAYDIQPGILLLGEVGKQPSLNLIERLQQAWKLFKSLAEK